MRIARGIQNKVLEAMAMGRPTVVTGGVARALSARPGIDFEIADEAGSFADKVLAAIDPSIGEVMGRRARARVLADYNWSTHLAAFEDLLGAPASPRVATVEASLARTQPMTASAQ
jgi:glycosyltransferase involved in cell wall biosynthesis